MKDAMARRIMNKRLIGHIWGYFVSVMLVVSLAQAQLTVAQGDVYSQDKGMQTPIVTTALAAYTKWRLDSLLNYPQGLLTPHYAVAIVAQRLDDSTAQVEVLIAAEMKQYTVTIRPQGNRAINANRP